MAKVFLLCVISCYLLGTIVCPPVKPEHKQKKQGAERSEEMKLGLQYERYLKEVVNVLEEDEGFRKKLEETNVTDIKKFGQAYTRYLREVIMLVTAERPQFLQQIKPDPTDPDTYRKIIAKSGDIAKHLDLVSHNIRSKLDELKRREVERLNQIKKLLDHKSKLDAGETGPLGKRGRMPGLGQAIPNVSAKVVEAMLKAQGVDDSSKATNHHIDFNNPDTFEVEDLKKLIVRATDDLEKLDQERKKEFKTYEMSKEHMRREKLKMMSERERKEEEAKQLEMKKKHKDHPKMHHPGSKDQLEEVWEESDGMDKADFDAKTFFKMHDTDGDGYLDEEEVEALFQKELDKVYDPENAEDDMMERYEEMNRMREHVYSEVDTDQDDLISEQEFLESTNREDFDKDEPWGAIDEDDEFTDDEFNEFEEHYVDELEHAQPGEVNIPHIQPSEIPVIEDHNLRVNPQGQDHLQGQGQQQHVEQMQQQAGQGQPVVHDVNQQAQQQHQPEVNHQQQPEVNHQQQPEVNHQQQPEVDHQQQPEVNHQQQPEVIHQQQPEVNHQQQPEVNHQQQPVVDHQPDANQQQQQAAGHQQPEVNQQPNNPQPQH